MYALIVDQRADHCTPLQQHLSRDSWNVVVADSITQALAALTKHVFALLLIAIDQPDGTGFQLCTYVRDRHGHDPIIVLMSATTTPLQRTTGLQLDADDVLRTPCDPAELTARIAAYRRRRAMMAQIGLLEHELGA